MTKIPKSHPRYVSLKTRDLIVEGVEKGITSIHGLIAHGRGEAFDYLLGEKTTNAAKKSIDSAAALLLLAKHPVISVNGNAAALAAKELVQLSKSINAKLEVNVFHPSTKRELKINQRIFFLFGLQSHAYRADDSLQLLMPICFLQKALLKMKSGHE